MLCWYLFQYLIVHNFPQSYGATSCERFRPNFLGDQSIFLHEIDKHIPLTTITHRVGEQKHHQTSIWFFSFSCKFFVHINEKVCPFNSVPEVEILLTEFKVFQIEMLDKLLSNCIQECKNPTSPWWPLVGDGLHFFYLRLHNSWLWREAKNLVCVELWKCPVGYIRQHYTTYSKIKLINYFTLLRLSFPQANRFYLEYLRLIHIQMLIVSLQSRLLSAWIFQNQHGTWIHNLLLNSQSMMCWPASLNKTHKLRKSNSNYGIIRKSSENNSLLTWE